MTTLIALIPALAWGSISLISGKIGDHQVNRPWNDHWSCVLGF